MIFYKNQEFIKSYNELINDINNTREIDYVIRDSNSYEVFLKFIVAMLNNITVIMVDSDLSDKEFSSLGLSEEILNKRLLVDSDKISDLSSLSFKLSQCADWNLTLYTSGTTGIPKKVTHKFSALSRNVKVSERFRKNVWGYAFSPTHIAGIQVFLQALFNSNAIVDLFNKKRDEVIAEIDNNKITNISATSTYYRLLSPFDFVCSSVLTITSGGEKFDPDLSDKMQKSFPNARFRNIYASTEAGTIFTAKGELFSIPDALKEMVKIEDNEILIKSDLLGTINDSGCEWYATGDIVEIVSKQPLTFKFIHRKNEMINIGGYKVNPHEVEEQIRLLDHIIDVKVYGEKNSVLGSILCADIVCDSQLSEREIKNALKGKLQNFKIPRIINFEKELSLTKTGKIKR